MNFEKEKFFNERDRLGYPKRLVILESPYAPVTYAAIPYSVADNIEYARRCIRDSLFRGEAPIASHLLYTQESILDDDVPEQRKLGIDSGHAWIERADGMVVYLDHGLTPGMEKGITVASLHKIPIEFRKLK